MVLDRNQSQHNTSPTYYVLDVIQDNVINCLLN